MIALGPYSYRVHQVRTPMLVS